LSASSLNHKDTKPMTNTTPQAKHTPTRWLTGRNYEDKLTIDVYEQVSPTEQKTVARYCTPEHAHLIAAAPEMLEALERMLQWLIDVEESHGEPIPTKYKERIQKAPMIESVKQAIKKAKGQ